MSQLTTNLLIGFIILCISLVFGNHQEAALADNQKEYSDGNVNISNKLKRQTIKAMNNKIKGKDSQDVTIKDSPNSRVYQAGRDIVLNPAPQFSDRPILEPVLRIFSKKENSFNFKFLITNIGGHPAENIYYLSKSNYFANAELVPSRPRTLLKGARLESDPSETTLELDQDDFKQSFTLILFYESLLDGKKKDYQSEFKFNIRTEVLSNQDYHYEEAKHGDRKYNKEEQLTFIELFRQLDEEEGAYIFTIDETDMDLTKPTLILRRSNSKLVFYEPSERRFWLEASNRKGLTCQLSLKAALKRKSHKVGISWDAKHISFSVNGQLVRHDWLETVNKP